VEEKAHMLQSILNITNNQETVIKLEEDSQEIRTLFVQMSLEKQKLADKILDNDQIFNTTFENLENFEENAKNHKDKIKILQTKVKLATDLDVKIRIAEEHNKNLLTQKRPKTKISNLANKKAIVNKYKSNINMKGQ